MRHVPDAPSLRLKGPSGTGDRPRPPSAQTSPGAASLDRAFLDEDVRIAMSELLPREPPDAALSLARSEMRRLERHNADLRRRVAALESSTSWRLTAPLRWGADRVARRRGPPPGLEPETAVEGGPRGPTADPPGIDAGVIAAPTRQDPARSAAAQDEIARPAHAPAEARGAPPRDAGERAADDAAGTYLEFEGLFYQLFLKRLHDLLQPQTYLEIGTLNGDTLRLASCKSISIDPAYQIEADVAGAKPFCLLFQLTSDDFFAAHSPSAILGRPVEMAFLDGMHLFEFLLRDFMNTERHCARDSVVVLHDCLPGDPYIAVRSPEDPERRKSVHPGYWTGDVWKILPALKAWRPDLRIIVADAPPTGLVLVTNLDPANTVLQRNYQAIVDEYLDLDLGEYGVRRLHAECEIVSTETLTRPEDLPAFLGPAFLGPAFLGPAFLGRETQAPAATADAPVRYVSPLSLAGDPAVDIAVTGEARTLSRPGPAFHDDPDGAGLFRDLGPASIPHGAAFTATARGVRLAGYRSYLVREEMFFNDETYADAAEQDRFLARLSSPDAFPNEDSGLRPTGDGGFSFDEGGRPVERLAGATVSLCSFEPANYGAFLFRVLPKLAAVDPSLAQARVLAPVYYDSMVDLLGMAGVARDRLVAHDTGRIYELERAVIPSLRAPHALLDPLSLDFYRDLRGRFGRRGGARKLFVSRLGWTDSYAGKNRVMTNEEELARRLSAAGFETIAPHRMTARAQVEAFSSADVIIGASGSAMFNAVFCHPGTKLLAIESEPHWIFAHMNLYGSCGLDYGIIEAKAADRDWSTPHKRFAVNLEALMSRLAPF